MNYKTKHHSDYFLSADADTKKQYNLLVKLSQNFTKDNPVAMELDNALMELMAIDQDAKPSENSIPKIKVKGQVSDSHLEEKFNTLFESLTNSLPEQGNVKLNKEDLRKSIEEALELVKIKFSDLDLDVQKRFSTLPVTIRYELPNKTTPSFTKPPIVEFQQIVDDLMIGNNVFLIGGAGTGKTFMAENLLAKMALSRPHITINCSQWTSPTEIIGGQTMDGYVEGKLIEAWKNGWVIILDELPKIDPNTAGLFNDALAKTKLDKAVIFNARKESFEKHPDFACIATGNIYPDKESISYGANNKQDLSLLDRFSGSVYFIEKNPAIEKQIIQNEMIWSICDRLRSVIEELKYEAQLSLRFMQTARDAFELEMQRLKEKSNKGIKPDEGKTLKSAIDSYLSTFTEVQQKNLKEKIRYHDLIKYYQYREFYTTQTPY